MRKLILKMSISLDGFVAPSDGKWAPELLIWEFRTFASADLHLVGSRYYRTVLATWPVSPLSGHVAANAIPKAVFSASGGVDPASRRALEDATVARAREYPSERSGWRDARVLVGDLADEVTALKREPGGFILALGGVRFARSLLALDLVDQLHLLVQPVVLGAGRPFDDYPAPRGLKLVKSKPFASGEMALVYCRPGASGAARTARAAQK
jgi:dihydrofolate reductase